MTATNVDTEPVVTPEMVGHALDELAELRAKVDAAIAASFRLPVLDEARAACNEAGIHAARRSLAAALDALDDAQTAKRQADAELAAAVDAEQSARAEAEWDLDGRFVVEANKTYLVDGDARRQMTADERRAWKQQEADRLPAVAETKRRRQAAEERAAEARDRITAADRRFSAAKAELQAAVAVLETLRTALTTGGPR